MKRKKKSFKVYDILDFKEEQAIALIAEKNRDFFDLAIRILHLANDTFPFKDRGKEMKKKLSTRVERAILSLYTQLFRLYRAVIVLCRVGADSESCILLRSMLDTASYLLYIAEKDHDERFEDYFYSRALSDKVAVSCGISTFPRWKDIINIKWFEDREKEAIKYFKDKHGENITIENIKKKHVLRPDLCAQRIEFNGLAKYYNTFHRYASSIAHGENLFEYIKPLSNPDMALLSSGPTDKSVSFCLSTAMVFILCAVDRINDIVLKTRQDEGIERLSKEWEVLVEEDNLKTE